MRCVVSGIFGTVTGAVISKKLQSFHTFIKVLMLVSVMELLLSSTILIHCPQQSLHSAPTIPQSGSRNGDSALSMCQCSSTLFEPVCDPVFRVSYFSPCYAGCVSSDLSNCSCCSSHVTSSEEETVVAMEDGLCLQSCWKKVFAVIGKSCTWSLLQQLTCSGPYSALQGLIV